MRAADCFTRSTRFEVYLLVSFLTISLAVFFHLNVFVSDLPEEDAQQVFVHSDSVRILPNARPSVVSTASNALYRIMPLGDSITDGQLRRHPTKSYRYHLWKLLKEQGLQFTFVGSKNSSLLTDMATDFAGNHEGHSGWTTGMLLDKLDEWTAAYEPDVYLLHIGTNDILHDVNTSAAFPNIKTIISFLKHANPKAVVLVAKIIPFDVLLGMNDSNAVDQAMASRLVGMQAAHGELNGLIDSLHSPGDGIYVVDQASDFLPSTDTWDGIHPNEAGNMKMAVRWLHALETALQQR